MAENVRLIDPIKIQPNPENPRLIFREGDLQALEKSIATQGILVPLTVYADGTVFRILDGERRWRCARRLGLSSVPAHIQDKPDRLQNIMMMFAIHQARTDWDPLPTALKLNELAGVLESRYGRYPTESELAAASSLDRGEVRRYRRILKLPPEYIQELLAELEQPRHLQRLTVDHVLESTRGAEALFKRSITNEAETDALSKSLVSKFRSETLKSTVEPRLLPKIARAVERNELAPARAHAAATRLIEDPSYTVEAAYKDTIAFIDFEHGIEQLSDRLSDRLREHLERSSDVGPSLSKSLQRLEEAVRAVLRHGRA